jgi:serine/threonine protein kinase
MSSIWVALDLVSHSRVAVKVMVKPDPVRSDLVERFRREAEVAKRFRGPPFVAVLDHGEHEGTPYIVMQLLEGENLQQRLARRETLDVGEVQTLLEDVASGLRVAHKLGVIHRDLKPANLFFARLPERLRSRRDEVVKILDFGIARSDAFGDRLTKAGHIVGSLFYMSPEQARADAEIDARSDVWQVGAILYRCLTGRRPFEGPPGEVLRRLAREDVALASTVNPDLPRAFDPFFARALARSPEHRYQNIDALLAGFRDAAKLVSGTRPAVRPPPLDAADVPLGPADPERPTVPEQVRGGRDGAATGAAPGVPPPLPRPAMTSARTSEAPTVMYTAPSPVSLAPLPPASPAKRATPATVPAYFSLDRLPSQRPSPWAAECDDRKRRSDWVLALLLGLTIVALLAIVVVAVSLVHPAR